MAYKTVWNWRNNSGKSVHDKDAYWWTSNCNKNKCVVNLCNMSVSDWKDAVC